jgi:hypothetical protein
MNALTQKPLVLIGDVDQYVDSNLQPIIEGKFLKFLMIKDSTSEQIQMLLMQENRPHEYHAQALLQHMDNNNLAEIMVNGGGKVVFSKTNLKFLGKSYAFNPFNIEEVSEFCKNLWPDIPIQLRPDGENTQTINKVYSRADVKYEVDNP